MKSLRAVLAHVRAATLRLVGLTREPQLDARLREEIAFHIDMETRRNVALGLSPAEARRRAHVSFGGQQRTSDDARDELRSRWGDELRRNVRFALRGMRRQPLFMITVALTLALGIGANATMFGLIDHLLLRPPPDITQPDRIVLLNQRFAGMSETQTTQPYAVVTAMRQQVSDFSSVAVETPSLVMHYLPVGRGAHATQASGALVSGNFFATLGVHPALGRFFSANEESLDRAEKLAVIGYGFWQSHFGGKRDAIGNSLGIGTSQYTVVGVAPAGFGGIELSGVDIWLPVEAADGLRRDNSDRWATDANSTWLYVIGRLKPEVRVQHAAAEAAAAYRAWYRQAESNPKAWELAHLDSMSIVLGSIVPGKSLSGFGISASSNEVKISKLLAAVSLVVLLLACANVTNLLLLRALQRRREIAVRLALGVSRARLVAQLLIEGVILSLLGGVVALGVTAVGARFVRQWLLGDFAWSGGGIDGHVLAFTATVALLTGVATSLVPALQASRPEITNSLKAGAREGGNQRSRTRTTLLVLQAALAIVLLAGAGLFIRSVRNVAALDLGIDVDHTLVAQVNQNSVGLSNAQTRQLYDEFQRRALALPGVNAAAVSIALPFGLSWGADVALPGRALPNFGGTPYQYAVTPEYFTALGIHLRAGRLFTAADRRNTEPVVVVSETMAHLFWPNESPIGQCLKVGGDTMPCATMVGVVSDTRRQDLVEGLISQMYLPLDQLPPSYTDNIVSYFGYNLVVRTAGDPAALVEPLRQTMQAAGPSVPFANVRTMREMLGGQTRSWELGARVFTAFGALALVLAGIGMFSVVAFTVGQRRQEFGIRTALGAQPGDLLRLTLTGGLAPAVWGILTGLVLTLVAGRFVEAMLFGVSARDPQVLGVSSAALLVCAVVASLMPAMQAARTEPSVVLRGEG